MNTLTSSFCAAFVLGGIAVSQGPSTGEQLLPDVLPIHQSDDGGVWAAGRGYKVRLNNGFTFFPFLGSAQSEHQPLTWRTTKISIGRAELAIGVGAERASGGFRYEIAYPDSVEAYDISASGVEQTFTIAQRPQIPGDLVVTGLVDSPLTAASRAPRHGPLFFRRPGGKKVIEYGAATLIDARGRAFPMQTGFDGERIELVATAEIVAQAEFPVIVDPVWIASDPVREVGQVKVANADVGNGALQRMTAYTLISTATDHDLVAVMTNDDFGGRRTALTDFGIYSSQGIDVGAQPANHAFVIASDRRAGFRTHLALYVHSAAATVPNTGVTVVQNAATGEHFRNPSVGGIVGDDRVLVVYDHTVLTTNHYIDGLILDVAPSQTTSPIARIATVTTEVQPAACAAGVDAWAVCWANTTGGQSGVYTRLVQPNGTVSLRVGTVAQSSSRRYSQTRVAGTQGRFLATYVSAPASIGIISLLGRRFDWTGMDPTFYPQRTMAGGAPPYENGGLAFDRDTRSHWLATYIQSGAGLLERDLHVVRMGFTGATVDNIEPDPSSVGPAHPDIAFSQPAAGEDEYALVYYTDDPNHSVWGEDYGYPAAVYNHTWFGSSCATAEAERWDPSIAGDVSYYFTLLQHQNSVAVLAVGFLSTNIPLDPLGMPGCTLLIDPAMSTTIPASLLPSGDPRVAITLPDSPLFTGFVYTQWIYSQPGLNPLGFATNRAVAHEVR